MSVGKSPGDYQRWMQRHIESAFNHGWRLLSVYGLLPKIPNGGSIVPHEFAPDFRARLEVLEPDLPNKLAVMLRQVGGSYTRIGAALLLHAEAIHVANNAAVVAYHASCISDLRHELSDLWKAEDNRDESSYFYRSVERILKSDTALSEGRRKGTAVRMANAVERKQKIRDYAVSYFKKNPGATNPDCIREMRRSGIKNYADAYKDGSIEKYIKGCKSDALK